MVVTLPFPKGISAHNNGHWKSKAGPVADLRLIAKMLTLDAIARGQEPVRGEHVINYRFFVDDRKRRDRANMVQMCKAFIDGIADAKAIDGDHWEISWIGLVEVEIRKGNPGVEIEIFPKKKN